MTRKKWLVVTNKMTYLFLLSIPVALLKIVLYDIKLEGMVNIVSQVVLSIIIGMIGIYFFVRFNSYSSWFNPNHPKPED